MFSGFEGQIPRHKTAPEIAEYISPIVRLNVPN